MIRRIKIEGYKSIKELDLDMKPINLLIGSNGVGKSNFISFFKLLDNIYHQRLRKYSRQVGIDNLLHFGTKYTKEIKGLIDYGQNAYEFSIQPTQERTFFINWENSIYFGGTYPKDNRTYDLDESNIKSSDRRRNDYLRAHMSSFKTYHFHDTSLNSALRKPSEVKDNKVLSADGENLASFLYFLSIKHPKSFSRIESTIRSISPFFEKFNLEPDRINESIIDLEWVEAGDSEGYFNAQHLSDGTLRFIALSTLLLQPELPNIIIIDEPELGLHPVAINKLSGLIRSASKRDCQIIVSTQSVNLINNFEPEDVITVDRKGTQSDFQRLNKEALEDWLEDYSIGDLWTKNVIKGQP